MALFAPVIGFLLNQNSNYFLLQFDTWSWTFLLLNVVISGLFYFVAKTTLIDISILPSDKNYQLLFTLLPVAVITEAVLVFKASGFLK